MRTDGHPDRGTYIYPPLDKRYSLIISSICGPDKKKICPSFGKIKNITIGRYRLSKTHIFGEGVFACHYTLPATQNPPYLAPGHLTPLLQGGDQVQAPSQNRWGGGGEFSADTGLQKHRSDLTDKQFLLIQKIQIHYVERI